MISISPRDTPMDPLKYEQPSLRRRRRVIAQRQYVNYCYSQFYYYGRWWWLVYRLETYLWTLSRISNPRVNPVWIHLSILIDDMAIIVWAGYNTYAT